MTYRQVFDMACMEYENIGTITTRTPETFTPIEDTEHGRLFHFGIYWNDQPDKLCVVTYGPIVNFDNRTVSHNRYTCYAS